MAEFKVGDRVRIVSDVTHEKGKFGTIVPSESTRYLAVAVDDDPLDPRGEGTAFVADEIEKVVENA